MSSIVDGDFFFVCDVETTGLDPVNDAIVEIGAVEVAVDGEIVGRLQMLIYPGWEYLDNPHVDDALRVQGRTKEDVLIGEDPHTAAKLLKAFLGSPSDDVAVGFYNQKFDFGFLSQPPYNLSHEYGFFDIMLMAAEIMGKAGSPYCPQWPDGQYKWPKLREAAEFFEVDVPENMHNALADAEVAAKVAVEIDTWEEVDE